MAGPLHAGMFTELYTAYSWDKKRIQIWPIWFYKIIAAIGGGGDAAKWQYGM